MGRIPTKILFLDRDGTVIKDKGYMYKPEELEFVEGGISALRTIQASHLLVVVTNQSGIGRGLFSMADYDKFNEAFLTALKKSGICVRAVLTCPHTEDAACECRKPNTRYVCKWLHNEDIVIDRTGSYIIGDKESDIEFGRNMGIGGILISADQKKAHEGCRIARSLTEAVEMII